MEAKAYKDRRDDFCFNSARRKHKTPIHSLLTVIEIIYTAMVIEEAMQRTIKAVEMIQSRNIRGIFSNHRSFSTCSSSTRCHIISTPPFSMVYEGCCIRNRWQHRQPPPPMIARKILHIRKHKFSTAMSENEIQRRLDIFQDLYVVARDCMEDLVQAESDEDLDEDDDDNDLFFQQVIFVQESIQAATKEFNGLMDDLKDNEERTNQIMRSHGFKVKRLEIELSMLLQNTNINDDDNDNEGNADNDGDDDEVEEEDGEEDDDEEEEDGEDDDEVDLDEKRK